MGKFGLTKRCGCPRRAWTTGCPHTWHYAFQWKRRRYRGTLDDVLGRHIAGKTEALKEVEKIYDDVRDEKSGKTWYDLTSQAFTVFLPVKSVGVMGDGRTYEFVVGLRAVTSTDGMTADFYPFEMKFLGETATRIINEVKGVNRVVYDVTSKPPGTIEWE